MTTCGIFPCCHESVDSSAMSSTTFSTFLLSWATHAGNRTSASQSAISCRDNGVACMGGGGGASGPGS